MVIHKKTSAIIVIVLSLAVAIFGIANARPASALVPAPLVPITVPYFAAPTTVVATDVALTGAAAGGGAAATGLCAASVVCGVALVAGILVVGGALIYYTYKDDPLPNYDQSGTEGFGFSWSEYPRVTSSGNTYWSWNNAVSGDFVNSDLYYRYEWRMYGGEQYPSGNACPTHVLNANLPAGHPTDSIAAGCVGYTGIQLIAIPMASTGLSPQTVLTYGTISVGDFAKGLVPELPKHDPQRKIKVDTQCISSDGTLQTVPSYSAVYKETDSNQPAIPTSSCPAGSHAVGSKAVVETLDGTAPNKTLLTVTPNTRQLDINDPYADCMAKAGGTACVLRVVTTESGVQECRWGEHVLAMSDCDVLKEVPTDPTTQPTDPDPETCVATSTYECNPGPWPGPGDNAVPESTDNCVPSGWQLLNPAAYVKTTACVLKWAFIPSSINSAVMTETLDNVKTRAPVSYAYQVTEWAGQLASPSCGSECSIDLSFKMYGAEMPVIVNHCDLNGNCTPEGFASQFLYDYRNWTILITALMLYLPLASTIVWKMWPFG